jgi:hypothetical protein
MVNVHDDSNFRHATVFFTYGYLLTTQSHPFHLFYLILCKASRKKSITVRELSGRRPAQTHNHCAEELLQKV